MGDDFPNQAFRAGHAFGFQFHPDVTTAMMHCWTTRGDLDLPGAQPRHQHFEGRAIHDVVERAWLASFIDGWLKREPLCWRSPKPPSRTRKNSKVMLARSQSGA